MRGQEKQKRGAPPKVEGGLTRVLYVRAGEDLTDALDAFLEKERTARRGVAISRADIIRGLLYEALWRTHR